MSASICHECEQPRDYGATLLHVCHCDETAGDLRVLIHLRDTELTRLRAALQAIADRQPHRPMSEEHPTDTGLARALARFDLAEMARAALGGGT